MTAPTDPAHPTVLNDAAAGRGVTAAASGRVRLVERKRGEGRVDWRAHLAAEIGPDEVVLDIGRSSRAFFEPIRARCARVDSLDINAFEGYPDYVADLCQPLPANMQGVYDVVIALAILQHVYAPERAVDNLFRLLKPGGRVYAYAPFIFAYHAPPDGSFQDLYRFSSDGLAYLFRKFEAVELHPVRGRYATAANLLPGWKRRVEATFPWIARLLDRLGDPRADAVHASGYNVRAVRPLEPCVGG